jgi:hypothetical protein
MPTGFMSSLVVLTACARTPAPAALEEFQKGLAFTDYAPDSHDGAGRRLSLDRVKRAGATWICLLATGYQESVPATALDYPRAPTPSDASLRRIIQYAHRLGLMIMLKPHVDLANDPAFILHYAKFAAWNGCDLFCAGCEFGTTAGHADEWRSIIAGIRKICPGPLTHVDNLVETDPEAVNWWDAVNFVGQDCDPTLTSFVNPTVDDLLAGWTSFQAMLEALVTKWDKPLILTEIGCRSAAGGAQNFWDCQRGGEVDMSVQGDFYEAAFRALNGRDWDRGVHWWPWSPNPNAGGPDDTGCSPWGRPAEDVLRARFAKFN